MTTITKNPDSHGGIVPLSQSAPGSPSLDLAKYRPLANDFGLTEEQTAELLQTLWNIMAAFVDLGFGVDVVQFVRVLSASGESLNSESNRIEEENPKARFNAVAQDARTEEDPT